MNEIVIADDEETTREDLKSLLAHLGNITPQEDGKVTKEFIDKGDPCDLFILDFDMPHFNGLELSKIIRSSTTYQNTPICVFTVKTDQNLIQEAKDLGNLWWILKPVDKTYFVEVVEMILRQYSK